MAGLGRNIWSDHFSRSGAPLPTLGLIDAQQPQIVRMLSKPVRVDKAETLQLHCVYNASQRNQPTSFHVDEAKGEMCNQYLFATRELYVTCSANVPRRCDLSPFERHSGVPVTQGYLG